MIGIIPLLMVISIGIAVLDASLQILFPNIDLLVNFSLVDIVQNILFIGGSLILWAIYTLERLTVGDFINPLETLLRMLISFVFIFVGGAADFFFDAVGLPFDLLSQFADLINIDTRFYLDVASQYVEVDFSTFTFKIGLGLDLLGNGAKGMFQVSLVGTEASKHGMFSFPKSGVISVFAKISLSVLGQTIFIAIPIDLEDFVRNLIDQVFSNIGSAESIYEELIEKLKSLGW